MIWQLLLYYFVEHHFAICFPYANQVHACIQCGHVDGGRASADHGLFDCFSTKIIDADRLYRAG